MIQTDNPTYQETLDILTGRKSLSPLHQELAAWLLDEFQITALNFEFREMSRGHAQHRYRLFIMLSSKADYDSMFEGYNCSAAKQAAISVKYDQLAQKYHMPNLDHYRNVFVAYCDFSEEIRADCNGRACDQLREQLKEKYQRSSVWDIFAIFSSLTVFYATDSDVQLNQETGVSRQIKDEYYQKLHALDEFRVFPYESFNVTFDSKENLDGNYDGNLYYYYK
jgi:hypothetical protein